MTKRYPDGWKGLPIHQACMRQPPVSVVKALIAAFPDGVKEKQEGDLPIHYAIRYGASNYVVNALYLAYPESKSIQDRSGVTCLDIFKVRKLAQLKEKGNVDDSTELVDDLTREEIEKEGLVDEDMLCEEVIKEEKADVEHQVTKVPGWKTVSCPCPSFVKINIFPDIQLKRNEPLAFLVRML